MTLSLSNARPPGQSVSNPNVLPESPTSQSSSLSAPSFKDWNLADIEPVIGGQEPTPKTGQLRDPRQATGLGRSVLFAIAGFCAGALSGAGVVLLLWQGLKDRFSSGVGTQAVGSAQADGDIRADGAFAADGRVAGENIDAEVFGWEFGVPANGSADFQGTGDLGFGGDFRSNDLGVDFDGDAAVDIGAVAPWKVVVSVAMVFGVVVGAFAWLGERQLSAADDRKAMLQQLNNNPAPLV